MDCVFCKIIHKEAPSEIVAESEDCIAFKDAHPKAPVHILIAPRIHIASVRELREQDRDLAGNLMLCARKIAEDHGIAASGYKLVINVGRGGGQLVDHLHLHLLGGWGEAPKD